jgi:hypothetical protein
MSKQRARVRIVEIGKGVPIPADQPGKAAGVAVVVA